MIIDAAGERSEPAASEDRPASSNAVLGGAALKSVTSLRHSLHLSSGFNASRNRRTRRAASGDDAARRSKNESDMNIDVPSVALKSFMKAVT